MNYKQIKVIERKNKERVLRLSPTIPDGPGIYAFTREEGGFRYAYIGQAKHLLSRTAQHLSGWQHIDVSLKKRDLYSKENPLGWKLDWIECTEEQLDAYEQEFIRNFANAGYQLYNHTSGGQGQGKQSIGESKSPKGYREGVAYGYLKARKEVANLFQKHLKYSKISDKPNKNQDKALAKFEDFINLERGEDLSQKEECSQKP